MMKLIKVKLSDINKFKRTKLTFHGKIKSRYNPETFKKIYLVNITTISQLISSKIYIIPKNIEHVHAYHPDYMKIIRFNANVNLKAMGINSSFRDKLLKKTELSLWSLWTLTTFICNRFWSISRWKLTYTSQKSYLQRWSHKQNKEYGTYSCMMS